MRISIYAVLILAMLVAASGFVAGVLAGVYYSESGVVQSIKETAAESLEIDKKDFVPAEIDIQVSTVSLSNGCYRISFDVTEDQAFSIHRGLSSEMTTRPLTHDIFKDVLNELNITFVQLRIERFGDEIYYARGFLQQAGRVLDLDLRPSDAIALSLRTGSTLYINQTMLREKGEYMC